MEGKSKNEQTESSSDSINSLNCKIDDTIKNKSNNNENSKNTDSFSSAEYVIGSNVRFGIQKRIIESDELQTAKETRLANLRKNNRFEKEKRCNLQKRARDRRYYERKKNGETSKHSDSSSNILTQNITISSETFEQNKIRSNSQIHLHASSLDDTSFNDSDFVNYIKRVEKAKNNRSEVISSTLNNDFNNAHITKNKDDHKKNEITLSDSTSTSFRESDLFDYIKNINRKNDHKKSLKSKDDNDISSDSFTFDSSILTSLETQNKCVEHDENLNSSILIPSDFSLSLSLKSNDPGNQSFEYSSGCFDSESHSVSSTINKDSVNDQFFVEKYDQNIRETITSNKKTSVENKTDKIHKNPYDNDSSISFADLSNYLVCASGKIDQIPHISTKYKFNKVNDKDINNKRTFQTMINYSDTDSDNLDIILKKFDKIPNLNDKNPNYTFNKTYDLKMQNKDHFFIKNDNIAILDAAENFRGCNDIKNDENFLSSSSNGEIRIVTRNKKPGENLDTKRRKKLDDPVTRKKRFLCDDSEIINNTFLCENFYDFSLKTDSSLKTSSPTADPNEENNLHSHFKPDYSFDLLENDIFENDHLNFLLLVRKYEKDVSQGPEYICVCCGGMFFMKSVCKFNLDKDDILYDRVFNTDYRIHFNCFHICLTCNKSVKNRVVNRIALSNGLDFVIIPKEIKILNSLEASLVAGRMPFIQVKDFITWDGQKKLHGNVINIPIENERTMEFLPNEIRTDDIYYVNLKRKMCYEKAHRSDYVRPYAILKALQYLVDSPLYKEHNIKIKSQWEIVDELYDSTEKVSLENQLENQIEFYKNFGINPNKVTKEVKNVEDLIETHVLLGKNIDVHNIAPGEGLFPISILYDRYAEELSFPKIYCGEFFPKNDSLHYGLRCKSEFRRFDNRCRTNIEKIFYSHTKLMTKRINGAINLYLKKNNETLAMTANNARDREYLKNLIEKNNAALFLRDIRSSPQYWARKKEDLIAMIKQLGQPSFFVTLSPSESECDELIRILELLNNFSTRNVNEISIEERLKMIMNDPIATARYFDHRMSCLLGLLFHNDGIFRANHVKDFFWRIEFQHRGSPHLHMMLWNEDVCNQDHLDNNCKSCLDFIDKYITCENFDDEHSLCKMKHQIHKHMKNCKFSDKYGNIMCSSKFPKPILDETIILDVFRGKNSDKEKYYLKFIEIRTKLEELYKECKENNNFNITLNIFLSICNLTKEEYYRAISASLTAKTVFLKRKIEEIYINNYNYEIWERHRSNMDIQFITDPYSAALYITSYLMKSNKEIGKLIKSAVEFSKTKKMPLKERLKFIGNTYVNNTKVGAQECAYSLLSLPVSRCSRETIFLNTKPKSLRNLVLKSQGQLQHLEGSSQDIFYNNVYIYYENRSEEMAHLCLAEFACFFDMSRKNLKNIASNNNNKKKEDNTLETEEEVLLDDNSEEECDINENSSQTNYNASECRRIYTYENDGYKFIYKERKKQKLLQTKYFNCVNDGEKFIRSEIMLFCPYRDEENDIDNNDLVFLYELNKEIIAKNKSKFVSSCADAFDEALEEINANIVRFNILNRRIGAENMNSLEFEEAEMAIEAEDEEKNLALITRDEKNMDDSDIEIFENQEGFRTNHFNKIILRNQIIFDNDGEIAKPPLISDRNYETLLLSLNAKQREYLNIFKHETANTNENFYHFISGGAGTGKSHLISAIYQSYKRFTDSEENDIVLCAFTGKAAYNIRGTTIHTLLHIPIQIKEVEPLGSKTLSIARENLKNLKIIIIDEISMVGYNLFKNINVRLKQIMNNDNDFGGISIIAVGDFNQLAPVQDKWIFDSLDRKENNIWSKFRMLELSEIMRQKEDCYFANCLNTLGNDGILGLTKDQLDFLEKRIIRKEDIPDDAICITFRNRDVQWLNNDKIRNRNGNVHEFRPIDQLTGDGKNSNRAKNMLENIKYKTDLKSLGGIPNSIKFKLNCKYMITTNIKVNDGLVNGAVGTLKKIIFYDFGSSDKTIIRIYLEFDDCSIGAKSRIEPQNVTNRENDDVTNARWTGINLTQQTIYKPKDGIQFSILRTGFQIIESEAMTIHKSQGQTYMKVAVNLSGLTKKSLWYVALSRVTRISGLYLFGGDSIISEYNKKLTDDRKKEIIDKSNKTDVVRLEMERLRKKRPLI